jgi:hypothetical protein
MFGIPLTDPRPNIPIPFLLYHHRHLPNSFSIRHSNATVVTSVHSNVVDCIVEYNNEIAGVIIMAAKICLQLRPRYRYPRPRGYIYDIVTKPHR